MHFQTGTFEELQASMAVAEAAANAATTDAQRALTFGSYWMRPMGPEYDNLVIFGRINTVVEIIASELLGVTEFHGTGPRAAALEQASNLIDAIELELDQPGAVAAALRGDGSQIIVVGRARRILNRLGITTADPDEFGSFLAQTTYPRGYRFGRAWSLAEPRGEYGDTHVSQMIPLRDSEFGDARDAGWDFMALLGATSPHRKIWALSLVNGGDAAAYARDIS